MNTYDLNKCFFKKLSPFKELQDFQDLCDAHFIYILYWLLSTPLVYLCVLFIEKNFCKNKNKYKRL